MSDATHQRAALDVLSQRTADVSPAWAEVATATAAPTNVDELRVGMESIREGWLLHRGASRVVTGAGPDLALLIGDWSYAAGLCSVAEHGTLDDVAALARLVATASARYDEPVATVESSFDETIAQLGQRDVEQ